MSNWRKEKLHCVDKLMKRQFPEAYPIYNKPWSPQGFPQCTRTVKRKRIPLPGSYYKTGTLHPVICQVIPFYEAVALFAAALRAEASFVLTLTSSAAASSAAPASDLLKAPSRVSQ